ncbi:hypothetical protein VitviT2T_022285 [Vitis vinifera]|uniref:C2 NT-type domain-containing protein n=2 Tax=Vitis vinifera TaxID=29760 RepID=A0ABY9DCB3_VITVI|nr:uncharacterized protein LOC100266440 [Vitis vinifera]XP_059598859.1 uncharacterized protein LOC100266440 [Vitis vinifera]WKA04230.1 hypothetical protein VitviT2T_022285 [Vitis vinifera]|eukprot:XP_010660786.1 PREDICTED: uncharacterized protein LOC100266440 [Vitis vinifera]
MVLGVRTNNRKSGSVHVDYLIHIQEIKPWPPSQSLRSQRAVLIQWEHGDRTSGSTSSVIPALGSGIGDGKIEFNESFRLSVTLVREFALKSGDADTFHKNCLDFNLYEPRRDKTVRGQLLGTAILDLADYGIIREISSISIPMNCKRSFRNTAQPVLFLKIQPVDKGRTSSSSRDNLLKEASLHKTGGESVSALINEEYAEEAEITSSTDDDVSSHSSLAVSTAVQSNGGLPHQNEKNGSERVNNNTGGGNEEQASDSKLRLTNSDTTPIIEPHPSLEGNSSCMSSIDLSSDLGSPVNGHPSLPDSPESSTSTPKRILTLSSHSSSSSIVYERMEEESNTSIRSNDHEDLPREAHEKVPSGKTETGGNAKQSTGEKISNGFLAKVASPGINSHAVEKLSFANSANSQANREEYEEEVRRPIKNGLEEGVTTDNGPMEDRDEKEQKEYRQERENLEEKEHSIEEEPSNRVSLDATRKQASSGSDTLSFSWGNHELKSNILSSDRLKHVKSVRSSSDSARSNNLVGGNQFIEEAKEVGVLGDRQNGARGFIGSGRKDTIIYTETRNTFSERKIQQLEDKIKMLEGELREAAAIEAALYSVVAEHGSSMNKVHAPARRLSRMYLHACRESSQSRRASAARSAVSGLALVAKACGNDVPRLTFWLSNAVVLRAIISQAIGIPRQKLSAGSSNERNGIGKGNNQRLSPLKWKEFPPSSKENKNASSLGDWKDPYTLISALEKLEAWIFSRIIESVWWQTLTPHMQSAAMKEIYGDTDSDSRKSYGRTSGSSDQEQVNFALDLWKKAFKDACERLCPVRAGGHECGCLPVLASLVMEQCVVRLDVAMFNAILRESVDEIPTDPVSDPISDSKVLPIPAGKSSFGAGAQLKNVIGNWSRWLTDLFGMDEDDLLEEGNDDIEDERQDVLFKSFHLLNALSDLMMLPKDMLLSRSIRKEVCPTFGAPLIRRVLDNFVPDEFCPDPIPGVVFEALDSEDPFEAGEDSITNFPCIAAPIVYAPPPAASLASILGEVGNQSHLRRSNSSVLRKSHTSDDELEELNSPLSSIISDGFRPSPVPTKSNWKSRANGSQSDVRYQLLREVWMNSE